MKRYLVLAGQDFYPSIGFRDFYIQCDHLSDVVEAVPLMVNKKKTREIIPSLGYSEGHSSRGYPPDWIQVLDQELERFITIQGFDPDIWDNWSQEDSNKLLILLNRLNSPEENFLAVDDTINFYALSDRFIYFTTPL